MDFRFGRTGKFAGPGVKGLPSGFRWLAISLVASIGYFFATKLGFAFKFHPYPVSVLWPANAVVLSVLLLTPVRVWPLVLLFIFPAHLAAQTEGNVPWPMLLSWYVSNSFESVLGAAATRALTGNIVRFDRLRDLCTFYLCGALFTVLISSFLDSAFVELNNFHTHEYWELWSIRFFSNFFAAVTVVPVIVTWSTAFPSDNFFKRGLEAGCLFISLVGVCFICFYESYGGRQLVPVCLCLPLPLFLWAAVRFGVRGVSTAILGVAVFTTWTSVHQRGPFTSGAPHENALSIQTFFPLLSFILVPMAAVFADKKRISESLHASEQRYRMVVETQTDLLCRCYCDTTLTFANDSWCRFFRRSRKELLGKKILDFIPPEIHERVLGHFAETIVKRRPTLWECSLPGASAIEWQQWMLHPIIGDDGHVREIQAVGRDISKLKRAEEALRESEERYRDVVETQSDLVSRYLPDTTLIFANQAFCSFFGRSRAALIGLKLSDLLPPEAREKIEESLKTAPSRGHPFVWECALRNAEGNVHWHQWISYVITDSEGNITAIQSVGRDITSRKQAEEATRKLAHASRLATIGELTAIIVHEVSQPLNAILNNVASGEKLARQIPPSTDELMAVLSDIRHDIFRAVEAVRRVRTFSKKNEMEKMAIHLNTSIDDVLRLLSGEILRRHIQVHARLGTELPTALGDRLGLEQVILNLVVNAMDAVSEVPEPERFIWIGALQKDDQLIVSVKDSGRGIPQEFLDRLFESFFTTKREGLGLGLSISRSIIQAHGGQLWAENNKDRGATFCFTLYINGPPEPSKKDLQHSTPVAL